MMTTPTGLSHESPASEPSNSNIAPFALTTFDILSATAFVSGDTSKVVEHVRGMAEALCSPARDEVRLRTIARVLATQRARQQLLEALLGKALAARDHDGVELIERILKPVVANVLALLQEHRIETGLGRRSVVLVNHADNVSVRG